ncbi:CHAP domain-containing protein [Nonomuraea indica]|uniref:CHAP domain-containing protein n=1 Tax=Nonomuraea indica TaxID=1581193 RepID=UPI000C7B561C|nr:CHAP domain-containing protein [Nonomuraea indica]
MTKRDLSRAIVPTDLPRLAVGLTIAAGAVFGAVPAMAGQPAAAEAGQPVAAEAGKPAETAPQSKEQPKTVAAAYQKPLTADALLRVAESQVGVTENAAGGGTPFHSWYMSSRRAAETVARDGGSIRAYANAPWCAMFVSWVGEKAGARPSVGWDAYTVTYAKWFKANKRWGATPKPGAVVFFDWDGSRSISAIDHVGLVKKVNGDGTISTVEGNTGNGKVERRVRPTSQVAGYGYPVLQG